MLNKFRIFRIKFEKKIIHSFSFVLWHYFGFTCAKESDFSFILVFPILV